MKKKPISIFCIATMLAFFLSNIAFLIFIPRDFSITISERIGSSILAIFAFLFIDLFTVFAIRWFFVREFKTPKSLKPASFSAINALVYLICLSMLMVGLFPFPLEQGDGFQLNTHLIFAVVWFISVLVLATYLSVLSLKQSIKFPKFITFLNLIFLAVYLVIFIFAQNLFNGFISLIELALVALYFINITALILTKQK